MKLFKRSGASAGIYLGEKKTWIAIAREVSGQQEVHHIVSAPASTPDLLDGHLKEWITQHAVGKAATTLVLPETLCSSFIVDAPDVAPDELHSAAPWAIRSQLEYPVEEAVVDAFVLPLPKDSNHQPQMHAYAARLDSVNKVSMAFQRCRTPLHAIDTEALALRNLAQLAESVERPVALLYHLGNSLMLLIMHNNTIFAQNEILLSGDDSAGFSMNMDSSFDFEGFDDEESNSSTSEAALDVQRSLDFFQSEFRISSVNDLFAFVVDDHEKKFFEELDQALGLPLQTIDIREIYPSTAKEVLEREALYAIGAALRGAA